MDENDPVISAVEELAVDIHRDLELGPGRVLKAFMVADVLHEDGDRHLLVIRDAQIKNWEIRGMAHDVLADLDADIVIDWMADEDAEDV